MQYEATQKLHGLVEDERFKAINAYDEMNESLTQW